LEPTFIYINILDKRSYASFMPNDDVLYINTFTHQLKCSNF